VSEERRRFRLSDAIVLVAAAALMVSADRAVGWAVFYLGAQVLTLLP
jgi:hypothetical protein